MGFQEGSWWGIPIGLGLFGLAWLISYLRNRNK